MSSRASFRRATAFGAALIVSTMCAAGSQASDVRSPDAPTTARNDVHGINGAPCASCRVSGTTRIFTDRAAFLAALDAPPVENAFDGIAPGASGGLNYSFASLTYLVYTQTGAHGALYNGAGFVSTDRATDRIVVQILSDAPVTAIGGDFRPVDFLSRFTDGTIHLELDDGTQETLASGSTNSFRGFVAASPIHRLVIDAPDILEPPSGTTPDRWPAMDNLVFGVGQ